MAAQLIALLLIAMLGAGATLAYLWVGTEAAENVFQPGNVSCEVYETFQNQVKQNVGVQNTGNAPAYIRVAINVTWMKSGNPSDQTVSAQKPQKDTDYTIEFAHDNGWIPGADGYWYYTQPIDPGAKTSPLIRECKQTPGAQIADGYSLSVEILASAIQAAPKTAVEDAWNVTIQSNGSLQPVITEVET